jgi:hypothetical protein
MTTLRIEFHVRVGTRLKIQFFSTEVISTSHATPRYKIYSCLENLRRVFMFSSSSVSDLSQVILDEESEIKNTSQYFGKSRYMSLKYHSLNANQCDFNQN